MHEAVDMKLYMCKESVGLGNRVAMITPDSELAKRLVHELFDTASGFAKRLVWDVTPY